MTQQLLETLNGNTDAQSVQNAVSGWSIYEINKVWRELNQSQNTCFQMIAKELKTIQNNLICQK